MYRASRQQSTVEWLNEAINDKQKGEQCTVVAVIHYTGTEQAEVDRVSLPCPSMTLHDIAERFERRLQAYVHDMPGLQNCAHIAFYDGSNEPGYVHPFTKSGALEYPGLASEPPTNSGITQQLMRHNEALVQAFTTGQRVLLEGFGQLLKNAFDQNESLARETERLRRENTDAWIIVRNAGMQLQAQQTEDDKARLKEERNNIMIERLLKWAPSLINTILSRKVFPEAAEDSAIVEGLLSELSEEHIQLLCAAAPPAVSGLLATRAKQIIETRQSKSNQTNEATGLLVADPNTPEGELS